MDGNLAEEQAQTFGPSLQPPRCQMERDGQGLTRQDGRQHHGFCQDKGTAEVTTSKQADQREDLKKGLFELDLIT